MTGFDPNPLKELLQDEGATLMPYGVEPAEPGSVLRTPADQSEGSIPLLAAAFGPIELEYASLRTDCVIIDRPDRAVIEVWGTDALDFLGRMLTNDVAALKPGESCDSFWLNRKGRIDADLRVIRLASTVADTVLLDMEQGSADHTLKTLHAYIITEDVRLSPRPDLHRFSIHGPRADDLLLAVVAPECRPYLRDLGPKKSADRYSGPVWAFDVERHDSAGVPGYELFLRRDIARWLYEEFLRVGRPDFMARPTDAGIAGERGAAVARVHAGPSEAQAGTPDSIRLRPCGWFAYNIARIEAGTPIFKIDFGPENLPAETGVLDDRVNFKKGCYLGQEVVARMHARGHPKQRLVALRFDDDLPPSADGLPPLPIQGDRVVIEEPAGGAGTASPKPIGSITSSTFSPMLGRVPIAFAMLNWSHIAPGTRVLVESDGNRIAATVQDFLHFLPRTA